MQIGAQLLLAFVRFYQISLSVFLGGACKFYPSCSNYAYEAIARFGARRGVVLALERLARCRPFTRGGYDPVPDEYGTLVGGQDGIPASVTQNAHGVTHVRGEAQ